MIAAIRLRYAPTLDTPESETFDMCIACFKTQMQRFVNGETPQPIKLYLLTAADGVRFCCIVPCSTDQPNEVEEFDPCMDLLPATTSSSGMTKQSPLT